MWMKVIEFVGRDLGNITGVQTNNPIYLLRIDYWVKVPC